MYQAYIFENDDFPFFQVGYVSVSWHFLEGNFFQIDRGYTRNCVPLVLTGTARRK